MSRINSRNGGEVWVGWWCVLCGVWCHMWIGVVPSGSIDKHHWLKGNLGKPPLIARWQLGVARAQLRS